MSRSTIRGVVAVALTAVVAGCGAQSAVLAGGEPSASLSPVSETRVSCGGEPPGWPVSAMDGGIESESSTRELAEALETLASEAGIDAPRAFQGTPIEEAPWSVLAETDDTVTVAAGPWDESGPAEGAQVVHLERLGGRWQARGWGDCNDLAPVLEPGEQWVRIEAAPDLDPSSAVLEVLVNEVECTSGRDPRPYLRTPTVVEGEDDVTLSWTSEAPTGGNNCVGNAPVPRTVELSDPLGDRVLLDGSTWPARPVAGR